MNHAESWPQLPSSWQLLPSTQAFLVSERGRARHLMASGKCRSRGREYNGPSDAAQLAPEDFLARAHDSLESNSPGYKWWPGWRPVPENQCWETSSWTQTSSQRRAWSWCFFSTLANHSERQIVSMSWWPWYWSGCCMPSRCVFFGVGEWTKHGYHFFSLNRSGPRQKDGCMIAASTKFPRAQIRCVHHPMPGQMVGLRLKCVEGRNAGDGFSSVRMRQYTMRKHKQRHLKLFELNFGEN